MKRDNLRKLYHQDKNAVLIDNEREKYFFGNLLRDVFTLWKEARPCCTALEKRERKHVQIYSYMNRESVF